MLKPGVRVLGLRPELILAVIAAKSIWEKYGAVFVVTSVMDGTHKRASEHYSGCAMDLRVSQLTDVVAATNDLRVALGPDYDVILEGAGTPNAHCHVEFQPKESY